MKLVSFLDADALRLGAITDDGVTDLGDHWRTPADALGAASVEEMAAAAHGSATVRSPSEIRFRPPIGDAGKIICVGLNYGSHAEEAGLDAPEWPSLFVRFPSSVVGHEEPVVRPRASHEFDFEGELAVVMGRRARHVSESDALSYVGGYTCFGEHSIRDWQRHTRQATSGKNFWHSGAAGPWIVTADEIPDPAALSVTTRLNGERMQHDQVANLIFSVPRLIAYVTTITALEPGDMIVTGTPAGVGFIRKPPIFMTPGDRIEVELSDIGTLANTVVDEDG